MVVSVKPFSTLAFSVLPDALSQSVPNPFTNLLRGVDIELQYLIELEPFNPTKGFQALGTPIATAPFSARPVQSLTGALDTVYFSDRGFFTNPSDTPANTSYLPLVDNPFQFEVSILNGRDFRGGTPAFGAIRIATDNGAMDFLADYFWAGRAITIYAGGKNFERSEFEPVFKGIVSTIEFDAEEIIINVSDKTEILRTSFSQSLYAGTGSTEGGADIKGDVKPLAYGEVKNIPLKLIDAANLIYQAHDGAIEAVDAVYDKGVAITFDSDVADITTSPQPPASKYDTQLSGGYIRLGTSPSGTVTADVRGDNTGGYINKAGAILSRLVKTKLGNDNFESDDVDQGSLNEFDASLNAPVGVFIKNKTTLNEVLDRLFVNLSAYWFFKRDGQISSQLIDTPGNPVITIDEDLIVDDSFEALEVIPASWRIKAGYGKNWQLQSQDDIAAGATLSQKTFALEEFRKLLNEDENIRSQTKSDNEKEFNSLLLEEADAQDYLDRLVRIYGTSRRLYKFKAIDILFKVFVGDVVNLKYPRYGLESGKNFIITGIAEDAQDNETELEVWG